MGLAVEEGETAISRLESYFGALPDPRAGNATHRLGDLIVIMIAASLCGASKATEFSLFARERKQALSRLIDYEAVPSHDTFSRLLRLLDPEAFGRAFAAFAAGFARACQDVISLDGKALRRAYEKGLAASPPLAVSAFAAQTRLCLAAASPGDGENEVEAALKVIDLLDLAGTMVTADALHCHKRMAQAVTGRRGDYLLALKGNRRHWVAQARHHLAETVPAVPPPPAPRSTAMWRAQAIADVTPYSGGGTLTDAIETAIAALEDPFVQSAARRAWNSGATTFDLDGQIVPVLMGALGMTEEDVLPLIEAAESLPA